MVLKISLALAKNFITKLPRTTLGTGLARTGTNTGTPKEKNLNIGTPLTADRLDTGANWRVLVLSPAHHRSRLSDSVKTGNALSTVHNAAVPAR